MSATPYIDRRLADYRSRASIWPVGERVAYQGYPEPGVASVMVWSQLGLMEMDFSEDGRFVKRLVE